MPDRKSEVLSVCENRKARYDYFVTETMEAGIELRGTEVKALRERNASIKEGWAQVRSGEVFLQDVHIRPYSRTSDTGLDPLRTRRLLLNARQIRRLAEATERQGMTIVPLKLYFKGPWAKVEIAVAKAKRKYDRRNELKKREARREMTRATGRHLKSR